MSERVAWIATRVRVGWVLLGSGIVVTAAGIVAERLAADAGQRLTGLTAVGILLLGGGIGLVVRYRGALHDPVAARRIAQAERDERTVAIRTRAGNRAFWASAAIVYVGLLWSSVEPAAPWPVLAGDTLWLFLAAAVIVPFVVYAASAVLDERRG